MATLLIHNISEEELAELGALARQDNVPLEQEAIFAIRHYASARNKAANLIPRDQVMAAAESLHRDMANREEKRAKLITKDGGILANAPHVSITPEQFLATR